MRYTSYSGQLLAFFTILTPGLLDMVAPLLGSLFEQSLPNLDYEQFFHPTLIASLLTYGLTVVFSIFIISLSHAEVLDSILTNQTPLRQRFLLNYLFGMALWSIIIGLNSHFFPHSIFTNQSLGEVFNSKIMITIAFVLVLSPMATLLLKSILILPKTITIIAVLLGIAIYTFNERLPTQADTALRTKRNVFIIGIDSLRPELIQQYMPFLHKQIKSSRVFPNTYTPFARTYPAWLSIVSGRYPHNNGARFNLSDESLLSPENTYLPTLFKSSNYQTVYGADERRFSNLGSHQGFERIVGPKTGLSDFIIGSIADFPTTNLMLLSPLSRYIFPEIYGNRAIYKLYYPQQFSTQLSSTINALDKNRPLFMAVHFCLPHWPYTYANHLASDDYQQKRQYPQNLRAVDRQIESLMNDLDGKGLLNNSIIVFLSDHGESWGRISTGLINKEGKELEVTDFGHGMSVLSEDSHKILLALKANHLTAGTDNSLRSLVDIAPTIIELLRIDDLPNTGVYSDGISLLKSPAHDRSIYFESGIVLSEANNANPDAKEVAKAGLRHFNVTGEGYLRVSPSAYENMLKQKQLGVRTVNEGLYFGKFTGHVNEVLLANYSNATYSVHSIDDFNATQHKTKLLSQFCIAYENVNSDTAELCNQLKDNAPTMTLSDK